MSKAKIAALVGCIMYSVIAFIGIIGIGLVLLVSPDELQHALNLQGAQLEEVLTALFIASILIIILLVFNWISFARLNKGKGWRIYLFAVGIFYLVASMLNGAGLIITLPVAICFILAFIWSRRL